MRKTISGFTVVEILIVVGILAILATVVTTAFTGSRRQADNSARLAELKTWQKSFVQYKAANGQYPNVPDGGYCLGSGFPDGKCRDYYLPVGTITYGEVNSVTLMNMLKTYDIPKTQYHTPINGSSGPYVEYYSAVLHLTQVFNGNSNDCPSGTYYSWGDGNGRVLCRIALQRE
jgi:prepilin-type N-terminal cleavage/methylation domain-containing protein